MTLLRLFTWVLAVMLNILLSVITLTLALHGEPLGLSSSERFLGCSPSTERKFWMNGYFCVSLLARPSGGDSKEGIQKYEQLEYERARYFLERALIDPNLSREDRILTLAYLARAHAVLKEPISAQKVFVELLALAPGYKVLASESPLIHQAYQAAVAEQRRDSAPEAKVSEATDLAQVGGLAHAGASGLEALTHGPTKEENKKPVISGPMIWVIAALAVAGLTVGGIFLFRNKEDPEQGYHVRTHF